MLIHHHKIVLQILRKKYFQRIRLFICTTQKPLKGELSGDDALEIDGRLLVEMGKTVQTTDGKKGKYIVCWTTPTKSRHFC